MHWSTALSKAAEQFDGGARSFPLQDEATFASRYPYEPPNEDYERLFFRRVFSQSNENAPPRSAGWLIPRSDDASICKPVFIAHSTLAAIWLLRETLDDNALPAKDWDRLVRAATSLADEAAEAPALGESNEDTRLEPVSDDNDVHAPPSAQPPRDAPTASQKRSALSSQASSPEPPVKRIARGGCGGRGPKPVPSDGKPKPGQYIPSDDDADQGQPVVLVTTVTNNNRRAEQRRAKRLEASRAKKRREIGLLPPSDNAPLQERVAYNGIAQNDEPTISWILKQSVSDDVDFYSATATPYFTACSMVAKGRALGNQSSQYYAAQFLQTWREQGTPFLARSGEHRLLQHSQFQQDVMAGLSQRDKVDGAFCFAWDMCTRYETALAAVHISSRWACALLGEAYTRKIQQLQNDDRMAGNDQTRNRYGRGPVRTEAIAALMQLVYVQRTPSKKDHEVFRNRIKQAMRWHTIVQALGWGSLLLIPHEEVSNHWLERVLRVRQLDIFLALVKRERPEICEASKALEAWLGPDGIAGAPISEKQRLSIETDAPATVWEIEEVLDSEDEEMDKGVDVLGSPVSESSMASPAPLRQMSLLELFHPVTPTT